MLLSGNKTVVVEMHLSQLRLYLIEMLVVAMQRHANPKYCFPVGFDFTFLIFFIAENAHSPMYVLPNIENNFKSLDTFPMNNKFPKVCFFLIIKTDRFNSDRIQV